MNLKFKDIHLILKVLYLKKTYMCIFIYFFANIFFFLISIYSHMQGHWPIIMKNIHKLHAFKVISVNLIYTNT